MDFDKYRNKLPYPQRPKPHESIRDFISSRTLNSLGLETIEKVDLEVEGTFKESSIQYKEWKKYKEAYLSYLSGRIAYQAEESRLSKLFKEDALKDVGLVHHPKADRLFEIAYEHGHSGGYSEVHYWVVELSPLLN